MSKPAESRRLPRGEQGCSSRQQELLGDSPRVHPQGLMCGERAQTQSSYVATTVTVPLYPTITEHQYLTGIIAAAQFPSSKTFPYRPPGKHRYPEDQVLDSSAAALLAPRPHRSDSASQRTPGPGQDERVSEENVPLPTSPGTGNTGRLRQLHPVPVLYNSSDNRKTDYF